MNIRNILKWLAIAFVVLALVAIVGGGIVYATTSASRTNETSDEVVGAVNVAEDDAEPGIVVASVDPEGPAAEAGVVRGDVLLEIDGEPVSSMLQLQCRLEDYEAGDEVALEVLHGDDARTLTATLGERDGRPYLGVVPCGDIHGMEGFLGGFPDEVVPFDELPFELSPFNEKSFIMPPGQGAIVWVAEGSPAEEAGLQAGDRITKVDGEEVSFEDKLWDLIAAHQPGDTVTLEIERPGEEEPFEVTVELGEHPEEEGKAYLGVYFVLTPPLPGPETDIWPFDQHSFKALPFGDEPFFIPPEGGMQQGAIIMDVAEGSPAEQAGLSEGDVITKIDGEPVEGRRDLVDAIAEHKPGDVITLTVYSPGEEAERQVEVTLAEHPEGGKAYLGVSFDLYFELPPEQ